MDVECSASPKLKVFDEKSPTFLGPTSDRNVTSASHVGAILPRVTTRDTSSSIFLCSSSFMISDELVVRVL